MRTAVPNAQSNGRSERPVRRRSERPPAALRTGAERPPAALRTGFWNGRTGVERALAAVLMVTNGLYVTV
ncbi:Hypp477 [Branchiostoma lanceolatum]|uniref:Hypp477 protein n=1 Tax=Branchiostoma lanceolatum TaxID=7740 RepID=A0A8J9VZT0_BRALA|nr:Hypp477 [Branchiostoma lanceolatum]